MAAPITVEPFAAETDFFRLAKNVMTAMKTMLMAAEMIVSLHDVETGLFGQTSVPETQVSKPAMMAIKTTRMVASTPANKAAVAMALCGKVLKAATMRMKTITMSVRMPVVRLIAATALFKSGSNVMTAIIIPQTPVEMIAFVRRVAMASSDKISLRGLLVTKPVMTVTGVIWMPAEMIVFRRDAVMDSAGKVESPAMTETKSIAMDVPTGAKSRGVVMVSFIRVKSVMTATSMRTMRV